MPELTIVIGSPCPHRAVGLHGCGVISAGSDTNHIREPRDKCRYSTLRRRAISELSSAVVTPRIDIAGRRHEERVKLTTGDSLGLRD